MTLWMLPAVCAFGAAIVSVDVEPLGRHAVGDPLSVRIRVSGGAEFQPQIALPDTEDSDIAWGKPEARKTGDGWEISLPLQVFRVGEMDVPEAQIGIGAEVLKARIPVIEIVSVRTGEDADHLKDVRPPVGFPSSLWKWLLAAAGVALTVWLFGVWRERRPTVEREKPEPSPEEWLAAQFERLSRLMILDEEDLRAFVAEVADVIRNYLARKARIPAPLRTTGETVAVASGILSVAALRSLEMLLSEADFVKFAKHVPPEEAASDYLERARRFCASLTA